MKMNAKEINKQVLDFQKGAFAGWYGVVSSLQDQAASAVDTMLDQTSWIPEQGRQIISSWLSACKNERDRYKIYMEESFAGLEKHLAQDAKAATAKPAKPAAQAKAAAPVTKSAVADVEGKKTTAGEETK